MIEIVLELLCTVADLALSIVQAGGDFSRRNPDDPL